MGKWTTTLLGLFFTCAAMAASIFGPELLTEYQDKSLVGEIHTGLMEAEEEGYQYTLSPGEKLYILSAGLNSYVLPESEQYALGRNAGGDAPARDSVGSYSFVVNRTDRSEALIRKEDIFDVCNQGMDELKNMGILPDSVEELDGNDYDAVLYSAIDVLEPRNNVAVWKLGLSNIRANQSKENRLIDACIDADNGKIYEFYVRAPLTWGDVDPDGMASAWSRYMGLGEPVPYEGANPLSEPTPYFKKYIFSGAEDEETVVTIGFYEGINELFLKVSQ